MGELMSRACRSKAMQTHLVLTVIGRSPNSLNFISETMAAASMAVFPHGRVVAGQFFEHAADRRRCRQGRGADRRTAQAGGAGPAPAGRAQQRGGAAGRPAHDEARPDRPRSAGHRARHLARAGGATASTASSNSRRTERMHRLFSGDPMFHSCAQLQLPAGIRQSSKLRSALEGSRQRVDGRSRSKGR